MDKFYALLASLQTAKNKVKEFFNSNLNFSLEFRFMEILFKLSSKKNARKIENKLT